MVDEPRRITPAGDADAADGSASPSESEWRAGLAELVASIQRDLSDALDGAREQALRAIRSIEERGADLFSALDEERSGLDAERAAETAAREERVAALQKEIDGVEAEIASARAEAEREAEFTRATARRRADSIISEAEARAEAIIAEARERAASAAASQSSPAGDSSHDAQGRLRGLSDRVGRLLSQPGAGVAAAGAAAGAVAAASVPSTPPPPTVSTPPPAASAPPPPPPAAPPVEGDEEEPELAPPVRVPDAGEEAAAHDASAEQQAAFSAPPTPPLAPVVQLPSSGAPSWFKDDLADDEDEQPSASEAETETVPDAPVWSPSDALRIADQEEDEAEAEAPTGLHAVPSSPRAESQPAAEESAPTGPVTQTLIFQAVPNFQAALALERSLKAMSEVREVRVADFDDRQLTFQVTHELGGQLPRVLLTQRGSELELVDSRPERVEFVFRN